MRRKTYDYDTERIALESFQSIDLKWLLTGDVKCSCGNLLNFNLGTMQLECRSCNRFIVISEIEKDKALRVYIRKIYSDPKKESLTCEKC